MYTNKLKIEEMAKLDNSALVAFCNSLDRKDKMVQLDKKAMQNLIKLCRINCTESEQEKLMTDLGTILNYIEQLNEVNTENVPPCNQVLQDMVNVMREDCVGDVMPREVFLANAPSQVGGMVRVPLVLKP